MTDSKVLRMLGLAQKAGKVVTGAFLCEKAVKQKKAFLILIADDAAASTKELFLKFDLPILTVESKAVLGKSTGKDERSVAVVCDRQFAKAIYESEEC